MTLRKFTFRASEAFAAALGIAGIVGTALAARSASLPRFCYYPDPTESDKPGVVEYRRLMARYYPKHPLNRYSLYGYVFGRLVVEGLTRAGRELSRERFVDAMETISKWDSGGIPAVDGLDRALFAASDRGGAMTGTIMNLTCGSILDQG